MKTNKRDLILDALQDILVNDGTAAVTLEAVAAAAGVSKGGLLYHFPSKSALYTGLAKRLREAEELEFARARQQGIVEGFLRSSITESTEGKAGYWALLTALQGRREDLTDEAVEHLHYVFNEWSVLLAEEVDDPALLGIIRLVGDGLFLTAISGLPQAGPEVIDAVVERLVSLVEVDKQA
ncbi:TetR/AcrR family transcriptional regulator [Natronoglycomyces albus]|uniref:TetR/AcrR family transcriptional regulator n=1 Tax=Natronoglycomyces albus TaxID=2811108 RepID=A0A895XNW9_9ACTN|nr:TetR/AcrR family transcriptional regulator [Natronoglycomyces albus]QSB03990.1 TetR/AcrR family transcriptional regulator [Natronoglycomyces albus]